MTINDSPLLATSSYSTAAASIAEVVTSPSLNAPKPRAHYVQEPIAVVGMACRLPGESNSPRALWDFLKRGGVAANEAPASRFKLSTHHDGSKKPKTMRSPGGMFLESIDPQEFDAQFFGISRIDAIAMDPQQRQLLEVVYESLENAGIPIEKLDGAAMGCFVGSYAVDYADMQARDPDDRAPSITVGVGRAILSNRISHFLNIKGPSMTVDTACSGSLVGVDLACRYLGTGDIDGAIVAGANIYLSPDHNMDGGAMKGASSLSGKCHTFDIKADGYIKAEGVNAVILKRLDDALRDGDPIRAIIRGTATNSDGRTPGIASPSSEAQASAIRAAYANASISDLSKTTYLECHGTGTQVGDPLEVQGVSSVFADTRPFDQPLIIGSIKSNVGHSEPAAGVSGLLKAILAMENGFIPGNPTFETPNPKIDFHTLKVRASKIGMRWPRGSLRRASVNSFGYGGSNAHAVLEDAKTYLQRNDQAHVSSFRSDDEDFFAESVTTRPYTLVISANDEKSLRSYCKAITQHLMNPGVSVKMPDLAYTLSERRSRHFHRGYVTASSTNLDETAFVFGKRSTTAPRLGFIFTGQGAQWSQMGKGLVDTFPLATVLLKHLDDVLKALPSPPVWSLLNELIEPRRPETLRLPEFSQPLVTALQLVIFAILKDWGITPQSVVGHSSGEIAAACAAGFITPEEAIKIAYFRGQAATECKDESRPPLGMLAVGLGSDEVQRYIAGSDYAVQIGCYNSPSSVTLSGDLLGLESVKSRLDQDHHFNRLLQVDLAYHSSFMADIGKRYEELLLANCESPLKGNGSTTMFSSVTGEVLNSACDAHYWMSNATNPVRFEQATSMMVTGADAPDFLIELGPSGALAGPVAQIKKSLPSQGAHIQYCAASTRGKDSVKAIFDVAGRLFIAGGPIDLARVNSDEPTLTEPTPSVIVDLPNYIWNHSAKYWHESESSKDWRFRQFPHHDLLGSKVLGTSWFAPCWKKILRLEDLPWLKDHKMGHEIVFPGAGYIAMAMEAIYQTSHAIAASQGSDLNGSHCYRLRDVRFPKALVLEDGKEQKVMLSLAPRPGTTSSWREFKVLSLVGDVWNENSRGLVFLDQDVEPASPKVDLSPFAHASPGRLWYKAMHDAGYNFGPLFQKQLEVECTSGFRQSRSLVSLSEPESLYPQSSYPLHPTCIDGCMQTCAPSLWKGNRSSISAVLVPAIIDSLNITALKEPPQTGIAVSSSKYVGLGRKGESKSYMSEASVHDPATGLLFFQLSGLRYHKLDTRENLHAAHNYSRVLWNPDITHLSQEGLLHLPAVESPEKASQILNLLAHKKPNLKVMELNLINGDSSSLWLNDTSDKSLRAARGKYSFVTSDASALIEAQAKFQTHMNVDFSLSDFIASSYATTSSEKDYDLVIVRIATSPDSILKKVIWNVREVLSDDGHVLFLEEGLPSSDSSSGEMVHVSSQESVTYSDISAILNGHGFHHTRMIPREQVGPTYLSAHISVAKHQISAPDGSKGRIDLIYFSDKTAELSIEIRGLLANLKWQVIEHSFPFDNVQPEGTVLVVDELYSPILTDIRAEQWTLLQSLLAQNGQKALWVTAGSQLDVTNPNDALIHGLARTVRAEDPSVSLTTLDVESTCDTTTASAINAILESLQRASLRKRIESEYVERQGVIYVSRILPDHKINQAEKEDSDGTEPKKLSLHDSQTTIRLICERLGNLESLQYAEVSASELPLNDNCVEVELAAAGLNFKDIAVSMGIVPENQHLLGLEGAGLVRRIGRKVKSVKLGERVLVFEKGTFANRIIATTERVHRLPDSVTFEDASTMPSVYLTSLYCLFDLANTQRGHRVLIHSASGGVGIACIQLCQYIGAQIYVTVGTEEKREFLGKTFGIPSAHIFGSRSTAFAAELMSVTNGEGVDVIINSLTGDLLDESWRCIANGGTMVEIGKRDILDRNSLSLEPFGRNATYRGFDMSHKHVSDALIARLLSQMMGLMEKGHIRPISPIKIFPFEEVVAALRYMRGGNHIGKIVISNGPNTTIEVPVRPVSRQLTLRSDVSYLIVGGLKGLCGSLAIYLARLGAKNLVVLSRSGYDDERSKGVLKDIFAEGCKVDLVKGDVSILADVRRTFRSATVKIGGLIQGAMVLRDKIFTSMTVEDYHQTIKSKVKGTWNLHNEALKEGLNLDFFTMLSSISGVVGQKGQANYAAANVFLDNFAVYRRSLGLAACSVDLGAVEDVGYMSEHQDLVVALDTAAWTSINESLFHKIVRFSILQQVAPINKASASQLITSIAVPQAETSSLLADARFGPLAFNDASGSRASADNSKDGSKDIHAFFVLLRSGQAEKSALLASALEIVNKQFTNTLRLSEPMEPAKSLASYGLDSLAAVEFRNWVRMELGAELTTLEITNATSLFALCDKIVAKLASPPAS